MIKVYGIGNPLIDLNYLVEDSDLEALGLHKGIMHLIDTARRDAIVGYLKDRPFTYTPGGDCPNTMINLALLGVPTALSGKIGQDDFGRLYEERLQACGVQSDLSSGPGRTGSSIILVTPDGERTMNTYLGMCQEYGQDDVHRNLLVQANCVYFSGYGWDTEKQKDANRLAVSLAEAMGKVVAFDLADPFAVGRSREDFLWLLERYVDVAFANGEEMRLMFQVDDLQSCIKRLAAIVPVCAVKDGARGSWVVFKGEITHIPAHPVEVHDATGAGDTYAAGFLYGLITAAGADGLGGCPDLCCLNNDAVVESGRIASWLASKIITRHGAQLLPEEVPGVRAELAAGQHRL
jgi:sugar/nucleoside kinase (ribokinase family)